MANLIYTVHIYVNSNLRSSHEFDNYAAARAMADSLKGPGVEIDGLIGCTGGVLYVHTVDKIAQNWDNVEDPCESDLDNTDYSDYPLEDPDGEFEADDEPIDEYEHEYDEYMSPEPADYENCRDQDYPDYYS